MEKNIVCKEQGSFFVGGKIISKDGESSHVDNCYVFYQIPDKCTRKPVVFLHGAGQTAKSWETTPDSREGFMNIFLKNGYPVYLVDQPRRGKASRSGVDANISIKYDDNFWFELLRIGINGKPFNGSQFPSDTESMYQFYSSIVPSIGDFDIEVASNAIKELFDKIGEGTLIAHSQGCGIAWRAAIKSNNIKEIIAIEPGSGFVISKDNDPGILESISPLGNLKADIISDVDFNRLSRVPITIYYGDFIPNESSKTWNMDHWRIRKQMSEIFVNALDSIGGNAKIVDLPSIGIYGNSHFMIAEKNNNVLAEIIMDQQDRLFR